MPSLFSSFPSMCLHTIEFKTLQQVGGWGGAGKLERSLRALLSSSLWSSHRRFVLCFEISGTCNGQGCHCRFLPASRRHAVGSV